MKTALVTGALLLVASCSLPKPAAAPAAADITTFSVSATQVERAGESVTLTWATANASSLSLEQIGLGPVVAAPELSGSVAVTINADTVFALTAVGEGGSDARVLSVKVKTPARGNVLFTALPATVQGGESTTLVWNAPEATGVMMNVKGGGPIDLGGQSKSGTVRVTPLQNTVYELHTDSTVTEVAVAVVPRVLSFTHDGPAPEAGKPVALKWQTAGATQAVLTRLGEATPLLTATDAAQVAQGEFIDTAPSPLAPEAVLTYQLQVDGPSGSHSQLLRLDTGAVPRITQLNVNPFAAVGGVFNVTWSTANADGLEVHVDGKPVHVALSSTEVQQGNVALPTPAMQATITVRATHRGGGVATRSQTVSPVAAVTFQSFSADKTAIVNGGEPVVLSWNVSNARHVVVEEAGTAPIFERLGTGFEMYSLTVYPNAPSVTYRLKANNGAGSAITERAVTVTVASPQGLRYDRLVPAGGVAQVTAIDVSGGQSVRGLPVVKKNPLGVGFIDIAATGREVPLSSETAPVLVPLGRDFVSRVYGSRVSSPALSLSPNGWFTFSNTPVTGSDDNTAPMKSVLPALAIAPFWDDLSPGPYGRAYVELQGYGDETRLIVQWNRFSLDGQPQTELTFQAQLYGNGEVVFAYAKLATGTAPTATVGINDFALTQTLSPMGMVAEGDSYQFFGQATLPAPLAVGSVPYAVDVVMPQGVCRVPAQPLLPPGRFAITEVNPFPAAQVTDGEWIEVSNFTADPVDLKDWTLDFNGAAMPLTFTSNVVVPANGRLLLGQSATAGDGLTVGYVYGNTVKLPDAVGAVALKYQGAAYSTLRWAAADVSLGTSVQQDPPQEAMVYAAGREALSCPGVSSYGSNNQRGTPGAANPPCFPYHLSALPSGGFESIAATGTLVQTQSTSFPGPDSEEGVGKIDFTLPVMLFGRPVSTLYVSTNGFLSTNALSDPYYMNKVRPTGEAPSGTLAVFWDDLNINDDPAAGIYWERKDPSPAPGDEYTVVSWEHHTQWGAGQDLNFQVKFFASGAVEYHYGAMDNAGDSATVWFEDATGHGALPVSINSATAPGIHADTGWRFNPS
ncbi:MAG: lamin tail domain-containing protein [Myxococcaceae bacterium]|nr:lamin tail domain-containing protein [Myxococcaceae bacterium]